MNEKKANTLLGAFVVCGLTAVTVLVIYLLGSGVSKTAQPVVMVFDGSVTGLTIGAPVALRGVNIGQVTGIRVLFEDMQGVSLLMEVEADIDVARIQRGSRSVESMGPDLIAAGLRAQLNSQSLLTGLLYIQLDFFPDTPVDLRHTGKELFEIPTIASPLDQLVSQINALNIPRIAEDFQTLAASLRDLVNDAEFQALPGNVNTLLAQTTATADALTALVDDARPLIDETLTSAASTARSAEAAIPTLVARTEETLDKVDASLAAMSGATTQLSATLEPDSAVLYALTEALNDLSSASRALNSLAQSLEAEPQLLLRGRADDN